MKKIVLMLAFLVLTLGLTSCFDEASFKLANGQIVKVDQLSLKEYEVGQKVWLVRGYAPAPYTACCWEIIDDHAIGQIGFEPEKDTTFIFDSQAGAYKRRIALGVLLKKY